MSYTTKFRGPFVGLVLLTLLVAQPANAQQILRVTNNSGAKCPCQRGSGSLPERLDAYNMSDEPETTIVFDSDFAIKLEDALVIDNPRLNRQLTITGGNRKVTVDGQNLHGIFVVNSRGTSSAPLVTIANLALVNGNATAFPSAGIGGAIYNKSDPTNPGAVLVDGVTISGSTANSGAAIYNLGPRSGPMTITNSTINGNTNIGVGGVIFNEGDMRIRSSTITGNFSGGIENTGVSLNIRTSIVAANGSQNCFGRILGGTMDRPQFNISSDRSCRFPHVIAPNNKFIGDNVDPQLDPEGLRDNGGPTSTIALRYTSPARDAVPSSDCTEGTDQRGFPRRAPVQPGVPVRCDIGAFEAQFVLGGFF